MSNQASQSSEKKEPGRGKGHEWNLRIVPKKEVTEKTTNVKWRVMQALHNVDFRYGHDGIYNVCKAEGIDLKNLEQGNVVVLFNTSKTALKIAFSHEDIFHHRESRRLEVRVLDKIMERLNMTGRLSYPDALKDFLTEQLKYRPGTEEKSRLH